MTDEAIKTLTHAFTSSRQDNCNVLYYGITLEPSAISPERHCSSSCRLRMAGTHNTCPVAAPLAAGSSACYVQVGSLAGTAPAYLSDECHLTSSVGVCSLRSADSRTWYFIAHTVVTVFAVLPALVLIRGTNCRCSFENRTFHSTVLKLLGLIKR